MPSVIWKERIRRVPIVGPLIAWFYALIRLNTIRQHIAQELAELRHMEQVNSSNMRSRWERFDALDVELRLNRYDALDVENRLNRFDALDIESRSRLARLDELMRLSLARDIERDNRIAGLKQELRRLERPTAFTTASSANSSSDRQASNAASFDADSFYAEFENRFRGSREDIRERLKVYLPYLAHAVDNDKDKAHVVDVGCGRGEWLELLTEQGIKSTGIDLNSAMVNACRDIGLHAECMDAIAYLRQQPEGSVAAVTAFHVIEHLPFETLIDLFDAALLALRKDGLIIFETPNPENLLVGACNFYHDPTHHHPVVPAVAEFIARQRGFARAEILRLHEYPDSLRLADDSEVARRINNVLYGPQDFAVIAWKTYESDNLLNK